MEKNEFCYDGWVLRRVTDALRVKTFDCGELSMNTYFRRKSRKYRKYLLVQSYHFCPDGYTDPEPVVLVDLCNDVLRRETIPDIENMEGIGSKKQFLKTFPAVKIARLGRNARFRGMGASIHLLNMLKLFFTQNNRTGCRFLTLDAYPNRVALYQTCGFLPTLESGDSESTGDTISMFFDLMPFDPTV